MSPPGKLLEAEDAGEQLIDYEWLQQQLASAQLRDEDEEDAWVDPTDGVLTEALEAAETGAADRLAALLGKLTVPDLETPGPDGDTMLHLAALYGHADCVRLLLDKGCQADQQNEQDGSTALHNAAAGGYLDVLQQLLERAAAGSVNATDEDLETPLHCAARGGHKEVVQLLLHHGADVSLKSASGARPEDEADEEEVVEVLRQAANANVQ